MSKCFLRFYVMEGTMVKIGQDWPIDKGYKTFAGAKVLLFFELCKKMGKKMRNK